MCLEFLLRGEGGEEEIGTLGYLVGQVDLNHIQIVGELVVYVCERDIEVEIPIYTVCT